MVSIVFLVLIFLSLTGVVIIVAQYIPNTDAPSEEQILKVLPKINPLHKKATYFLVSKQRVFTVALLTKTIRRLKIISLRADNLATRLLVKIRSYSQTVESSNGHYEERDIVRGESSVKLASLDPIEKK